MAAVNRYAFKNDKTKDDEWIAQFAGACMAGEALRWYVDLDDEVQESWKRLRRALLAQYATPPSARSPTVR